MSAGPSNKIASSKHEIAFSVSAGIGGQLLTLALGPGKASAGSFLIIERSSYSIVHLCHRVFTHQDRFGHNNG